MLGQGAEGEAQSPAGCSPLLLLLPGVSVTCSGEEETVVAPAQEANFQRAEPLVPGMELSRAQVCAQECRAWGSHVLQLPQGSAGCAQRARGGAEGEPRATRGNAGALHPFHSMDNNVRPTSLFGKAPGSRRTPASAFPQAHA